MKRLFVENYDPMIEHFQDTATHLQKYADQYMSCRHTENGEHMRERANILYAAADVYAEDIERIKYIYEQYVIDLKLAGVHVGTPQNI